MYKMSIESKKWNQNYTPSQHSASRAVFDQLFSENLICRATLVRSGQLLGASLFAYGLYILNIWADDGVRLLVALSATSALIYIGLATQSRTRAMALLNLLAVPILFATAYAGMNVAAGWLILNLMLHASITGLQLSTIDKSLRSGLFCWLIFNVAMALLLLA